MSNQLPMFNQLQVTRPGVMFSEAGAVFSCYSSASPFGNISCLDCVRGGPAVPSDGHSSNIILSRRSCSFIALLSSITAALLAASFSQTGASFGLGKVNK